jgi:hypothetical protein
MNEPIKSYIFIWYIDIGQINPMAAAQYMEGVKTTLDNEEKLEDMLNAEVLQYFIPVRNETTRLEILEFNINSFDPFSKNPEHLETKLSLLRNKIEELIKNTPA